MVHARRNSEGRATPQSQTTNLFWKKPQAQFFKFNVDATLFKDQNRFGVGICLRGDEENFIKAKTFFNNGIPNPRTTKTWELLQAMNRMTKLQIENKPSKVATSMGKLKVSSNRS
ncbi:hypothetical protein JHK87_001651 [Glycine soja]|nr:hypothetical protein JHK87_001651 [Glycine soja]